MKNFTLLASLIFCALASHAQNYTPMELCQRILSRDTLPDIKKYCAGDFEGHPNGTDLPPFVKIKFWVLAQSETTAAINVTLSDSVGHELDTYFHFVKDSIWKVSAFRALAMTEVIAEVNAQLARFSARQVDSVIASPHTLKKDRRMFKTRAEYRFMLGNTTLTLASDNKLIAHFNKNKQAFETIKNLLIARGIARQTRGTGTMKGISDIRKRLQLLFIDDVYPNIEFTKNTLGFLIGGILDNAVGYMYIKDAKDLPAMSGDHFIMIRALGDGWYLYKTT